MTGHRYLHLDVFTDRPLSGNQLAVFPDARDLGTDAMQRIAGELAFSETTFVLPPAAPGTDVRVRIFTPARELPMAGHPTIGTVFALAHEGRILPGQPTVVLGLTVGPTPVRLEWGPNRLRFAWMTQLVPEFGAVVPDPDGLAAALGVTSGDIRGSQLPAQVVSSGVPFLFVPLGSRQAVDAAALERTLLRACYERAGLAELPVFVFTPEPGDDDAAVYGRMFAPGFGIPEDPATGGACGPLGAYLVRHGVVPPGAATRLVCLQGVKMGRPSRIHMALSAPGGVVEAVQVGGESVLVGEGTLALV